MDAALDKRVRPQFIILANFGKNSKGIKYRETMEMNGFSNPKILLLLGKNIRALCALCAQFALTQSSCHHPRCMPGRRVNKNNNNYG